jgi:hypothetical protein
LVLTWLLVTTSATAMAWWAVTFVTAEVVDRGHLRPSDVVAASLRQVVPVPTWVYGAQPVTNVPAPALDSPTGSVSAKPAAPAAVVTVSADQATRVVAPSVTRPQLVAQWSPTRSPAHITAANLTAPASKLAVGPSTPAPPVPAPLTPLSPELAVTRRPTFVTAASAVHHAVSTWAPTGRAAVVTPTEPASKRHSPESAKPATATRTPGGCLPAASPR